MTMYPDVGLDLVRRRGAEGIQRLSLCWMAVVAVFAVAVAMRHFVAANTDVSWLLIAGERWLDGERLYADILETNPPMAVLIYVPALLVARALGVSAEIVLDGLLFTAIAVSLATSALILRRSSVLSAPQRWLLAIVAAAVLAVLPVQAFGQREHIAVIELLPAVAALALRMNREAVPTWAIVVAGVGLGLALSFKPHFAIAVLTYVGIAALHLKSWRIFLAPENLVAAAVVAVYSACTLLFFPDYFTVITPLLRDVYSISLPLSWILVMPAASLWGLILIATMLLKRGKATDASLLLLVTASLGFGVVYFLQRKGWPYHSYPMMAFALLGLGYAMAPREGERVPGLRRLAARAAVVAALFVASLVWFNHVFDGRPLQAAVARLGSHPTILAISGNGGIAHPLTRAVGGIWASRQQTLLVSSRNRFLREIASPDATTLTTLEGYAAREREWLIADFRKYRPTIVLVDRLSDDWAGWFRQSPELVDLMAGYRLAETVMQVDIYVRRND